MKKAMKKCWPSSVGPRIYSQKGKRTTRGLQKHSIRSKTWKCFRIDSKQNNKTENKKITNHIKEKRND